MSPITIEAGPMFSRKSTELIAQVERYLIAEKEPGVDILVFNHASDTRYGVNKIISHSGLSVDALAVCSSQEIFDQIFQVDGNQITIRPMYDDRLKAVFIDEGQFFDKDLPDLASCIDSFGIDVYIAGLDTDFRDETFGPMGELMARADKVNKHTAICTKKVNGHICGGEATKTQRLVDGKPANYSDPIILVGASDSYTARCTKHHEVPGKPNFATKTQKS